MQVITFKWVLAFTFSFLITLYLIPRFIALAHRLRFVDVPDGKVKKHKQAVPYMGGVAVYCGFITSLALMAPFHTQVTLFVVGATVLLFLGLIDDLMVIKPYQKLFGQCVAALCFLKGGFYLKEHFFHNFWHLPISFFWIILVINAFNLVDVMDGLATILALIASGSFFVYALIFSNPEGLILLASFIGPLVAFFLYNRPPAKIYLGDAGSLFIGGFLATIPFLLHWGAYEKYGYVAPVIILAIPLLEVTTLIIVRTYKKIPFYRPSADHFCMYLFAKGWSKYRVLGFALSASLILSVCAFLFVINEISTTTTMLLGVGFLSFWVSNLFWK